MKETSFYNQTIDKASSFKSDDYSEIKNNIDFSETAEFFKINTS